MVELPQVEGLTTMSAVHFVLNLMERGTWSGLRFARTTLPVENRLQVGKEGCTGRSSVGSR